MFIRYKLYYTTIVQSIILLYYFSYIIYYCYKLILSNKSILIFGVENQNGVNIYGIITK